MSVETALVTVASYGLPGEVTDAGRKLDHTEAQQLVDNVRYQRIEGLLASAVDGGAVSGNDLAELAHDAHHESLATSLAAEEAAILALDALRRSDVDTRVLKGVASAHLDYPDSSWRVFGDADLLVRRADYDKALATLERAGFRRMRPPVRTSWERRFAKAVVLRTPTGSELDLHMVLAGGYFGELLDHRRIWNSPGTAFVVAERRVVALDPADRLLHACFHTMLGDHSGLRSRRDVAQLILSHDADWEQTVARASRVGADDVIASAITSTWHELRLRTQPAFDWANTHRQHPEQMRAIESYLATFETEWGHEGMSALHAMSLLDRARYLGGLAFPTAASLRARDRGRLDHLQHGWSLLRTR